MGETTKTFKSVLADLQTINWSETDGTDVKEILKTAFADLKPIKTIIIRMFNVENTLNKFQKMMITGMLLEVWNAKK